MPGGGSTTTDIQSGIPMPERGRSHSPAVHVLIGGEWCLKRYVPRGIELRGVHGLSHGQGRCC